MCTTHPHSHSRAASAQAYQQHLLAVAPEAREQVTQGGAAGLGLGRVGKWVVKRRRELLDSMQSMALEQFTQWLVCTHTLACCFCHQLLFITSLCGTINSRVQLMHPHAPAHALTQVKARAQQLDVGMRAIRRAAGERQVGALLEAQRVDLGTRLVPERGPTGGAGALDDLAKLVVQARQELLATKRGDGVCRCIEMH